MKCETEKNKKISVIISIILIGIIVFSVLKDISELDMLTIMQDELGYWGNAAHFVGIDWSPLLSQGRFYQMGYSLFLILPMKVIRDTSLLYKFSILLNLFFAIFSYVIACKCAKNIFQIKGEIESSICAFLCIYSVYFMHWTQIGWSECLLVFLMWISVYALYKYESSSSFWGLLIFLISLLLFSLTHTRSLPVVFIGLVLASFIAVLKKDKKIILILFSALIICIAYKTIRNYQMTNIWSLSSNEEKTISNADAPSRIILNSFYKVFGEFEDIINSLFGKIYILFISSFGFSLIAIVSFFKEAKKRNKEDNSIFTKTFIIASLTTMLIATSIQMCGNGRMDLVVYMRYFAYTIGPTFLFGIKYFVFDFDNSKKWFLGGGIFSIIFSSWIIDKIYLGKYYFLLSNSPEIGAFIFKMKNLNLSQEESAVLLMKIIGLSLVLILWGMKKAKTPLKRVIMLFLIIFSVNSVLIYNSNLWLTEIRDSFRHNVISIKDQIETNQSEVYFVKNSDDVDSCLQPDYLQFLLRDRTINVINADDIKSVDTNEWILSDDDNPLDLYDDNLLLIEESKELLLYKKQ